MVLNLYTITKDEILAAEMVSPDDIVLVSDSDSKKLYLYRGPYSLSYNQFQSDVLYERIINRFLNPNIFFLNSLTKDDSPEINAVKDIITDHYRNQGAYRFKHVLKNIFLLQGLRNRLVVFKHYENSHAFRSRVSNTSKMWRFGLVNLLLSGFLIVSLALTLFLGIIPRVSSDATAELSPFWMENLVFIFGIALLVLVILFVLNLSFVVNPLKFPLKPDAMESMLSSDTHQKTNPPNDSTEIES